MKKGLRKGRIVLSTVLALSMVMAAGCGNKQDNSDSSNVDAASTDTSKNLKITAFAQGPNDTVYDNDSENKFFQALAKHSNVTFDFTHPVYGNEQTEFDLMISSGEYTDLVWGGARYYKGGEDAAVDDGVFYDLTPYIEKYMPNYMALVNGNEEVRHLAYTDAGRMVSIVNVEYDRANNEAKAQPAFLGMVVRKDWLDEQGMALPETYDDWTKMLRMFKEKYGCSQPIVLPGSGYWMMTQFSSGYGALNSMQNNDGTIEYGPITEGWKKYVTLLHQWYEEGLIGAEYTANDVMGMELPLAMSNKTGAMSLVYTMVGTVENGIEGGGQYAAVQLPVENQGEVAQGGANDGKMATKALNITTHLKEEDIPRVLEMIDYMFSDEGSMLSAFGTEGESYTIGDDGSVQFTELITNNPDGLTVDKAIDYYCCPSTLQMRKDWSREYFYISDEEKEMCETWDKDGNALYVPDVTMTTEENTEYSKIMVDVETYMKEMLNNFIMGTASIDEQWDTYVQTIKDMGIEQAIADQQAALDRYMSK